MPTLPAARAALSKVVIVASSALAALAPEAQAANAEAGKARVEAVCAACHGATGVSVSDAIPNLAGQKAAYIEVQLKALKDGSRKNPIMNAMAAQLSDDDIANVAAYFAAQSGASGTAKSALLPNVAKSSVTFPDTYKSTFTKYHTINFPATRQVRYVPASIRPNVSAATSRSTRRATRSRSSSSPRQRRRNSVRHFGGEGGVDVRPAAAAFPAPTDQLVWRWVSPKYASRSGLGCGRAAGRGGRSVGQRVR